MSGGPKVRARAVSRRRLFRAGWCADRQSAALDWCYGRDVRAVVVGFVAMLGAASCSSHKAPARSAGDCVKKGVRTGVAGAKTGVTTGVEGVKAAGKTVGGFVEGGSDEARRRWQEGKADTKRAAHSGAEETAQEANAPDCP